MDKLPPVPPSAWSANASFRRRNQSYQPPSYISNGNNQNNNQNNRLKKFTNGSNMGINNGNINGNGHHRNDDIDTKNFELSIQEPNTNQYDEDGKSNLKNYDNIHVSEDTNDSNEYEEKVEININKDMRFKDFGFSVADSLYGQGVYVNKIRNGSPAEQSFYLKPHSKIYKV